MLPLNLQRYIVFQLSIRDCPSVFRINKSWNRLSRDEYFWKMKYHQDYERAEKICYREAYKQKYTRIRNTFKDLSSDFLDTLWGLGSFNNYKFVPPETTIRIFVPEIKSHNLEGWKQVFDQLEDLYPFPNLDMSIGILKYFIYNNHPITRTLVLTNQYLEPAIELYQANTEPYTLCTDKIFEFFDAKFTVSPPLAPKENKICTYKWWLVPVGIVGLIGALYYSRKKYI